MCVCVCVASRSTYGWKLKVFLLLLTEDVLDPVLVLWAGQLHWGHQGTHSCYYGLGSEGHTHTHCCHSSRFIKQYIVLVVIPVKGLKLYGKTYLYSFFNVILDVLYFLLFLSARE